MAKPVNIRPMVNQIIEADISLQHNKLQALYNVLENMRAGRERDNKYASTAGRLVGVVSIQEIKKLLAHITTPSIGVQHAQRVARLYRKIDRIDNAEYILSYIDEINEGKGTTQQQVETGLEIAQSYIDVNNFAIATKKLDGLIVLIAQVTEQKWRIETYQILAQKHIALDNTTSALNSIRLALTELETHPDQPFVDYQSYVLSQQITVLKALTLLPRALALPKNIDVRDDNLKSLVIYVLNNQQNYPLTASLVSQIQSIETKFSAYEKWYSIAFRKKNDPQMLAVVSEVEKQLPEFEPGREKLEGYMFLSDHYLVPDKSLAKEYAQKAKAELQFIEPGLRAGPQELIEDAELYFGKL